MKLAHCNQHVTTVAVDCAAAETDTRAILSTTCVRLSRTAVYKSSVVTDDCGHRSVVQLSPPCVSRSQNDRRRENRDHCERLHTADLTLDTAQHSQSRPASLASFSVNLPTRSTEMSGMHCNRMWQFKYSEKA